MPRGYRCIIVAFVGWLSLAAGPPGNSAGGPKNSATSEQQQSLDRIASAVEKAAQPSEHDAQCNKGENRRSSDLCAQWKAADAAKLAANVALWVGIVGTFIGGLTLFAAIQAARWAKKAAIETEKGATAAERAVSETQRIGEAQTRAYLSIVACSILFKDGKISLQPTIRNSGQSPALKVRWKAAVHLMAVKDGNLRAGETDPTYRNQTIDIAAQSERPALYVGCQEFGLDQSDLKAFLAGIDIGMTTTVTASAKDVFGCLIEARDDFIKIFKTAPPDLVEIEMTLGSKHDPETHEQREG
jgi:hypothetical protein